MKHTLFLSNYASDIRMRQLSASALLPSGVMDWGYKMKIERQTPKVKWQWGVEYIHHRTQIQAPVVKGLYGVGGTYHSSLSPYHTEEASAFVNNQLSVGALLLDAGIRYSLANQGKEWQGGIEPRIQLTYPLHENASVQCSYGLHRQYMHQVRLSDIGFPIDFWMPASPNHKAQYGHSFSCSYDASFQSCSLTVGGYYNLLYNQLEREGELFDIFSELSYTGNG